MSIDILLFTAVFLGVIFFEGFIFAVLFSRIYIWSFYFLPRFIAGEPAL
jgi:hypothetical protein